MDILTVLYGCVLGMFLTIGDMMALDHQSQYGAVAGRATWLVMVGVPFMVTGYFQPNIALVGVCAGLVLCLLRAAQAIALALHVAKFHKS